MRVAAAIMTRDGIHGVQLGLVAATAGVTRQLVYRLFPNRRALIIAVLEDFANELAQRFGHGAARSLPSSLEDATQVFVEAACDTIEANGAGPWELLDARGPDPEVARVGQALQERVVAPWRTQIAQRTGLSMRETAVLAQMIVAAGRAVLERWYRGQLTRPQAVRYTTRGVSALLAAFTVSNRAGQPRRAAATGRLYRPRD